jgi:hypothetical protein
MSTATNPNHTFTDWPELLSTVEANSGVIKVPMATLRQLEGRQRVGKHILSAIEEKLSTLGLGHLPEELPNRQQQNVVLYRSGTPVAELITAVRKGANEPVSETTYQHLYRFNAIPDPETVVSREEVGKRLEETAQNVLELLGQVRAAETSAPTRKSAPATDLTQLVTELVPPQSRESADAQ